MLALRLCAAALIATCLAASAVEVEPREVRGWLSRIQDAAQQRNFQGTYVVSAGGTVSSARIAHYGIGANQFERIEALDGEMRHVLRYNEVVHTLWPKSRLALIEQREPLASFPALLQAGDDRIAAYYELRQRGVDRMAGRDADLLLLRPRDSYRYGYRLWTDRETGLLLRVEILGEHGEVLESSAFSEVSIGVRPQPDSVLVPMKKLDGYRVLRANATPARLEAEGWSLRQAVPGFVPVSCVRRPLGGQPGDEADAAVPVLQSIYSDGLTHVSLFIEAYDPARHRRDMHTAIGASQTLMRRHGDWWITAMGDVPASTLRQFVNALEYKK